ncbi:carbohydrate kinase family protein [Adhaeribacter radiodurans]|uniref:Carbohydrate kinase n=1 Tax=Adhaeribacter radiodurans TaxID=2745197 RepID=A0A7L7LAM7_9BACT|nr:carbohydrate kinase [Adhaeribacter radiodurans]QMU29469.1 carbohydrate kinase [Adhaeribacter radiodurans]
MTQKIICFGETLWDMLPSGHMPGGAPMNVAIHLKYNNYNPLVISRVGSDDLGEALLDFLEKKKISTQCIQISKSHLTGVVKVNLDDKNEITYKIVEPVAWDYIQYEEEVAQIVAQSTVFVYGSLAARSATTRDTLLHYLSKARLKVFDVNLRPPHYNPERIQDLLHFADIVKMNHQELELIMSWLGFTGTEQQQMAHIRQKFNLQIVILTRGENGAAVLTDEGYEQHPGYKVEVEDTIGSGDSFLATYLSNYLQQQPVAECLKKACLVGAYVASCKGATPTYDPQLLDAEFAGNQVFPS